MTGNDKYERTAEDDSNTIAKIHEASRWIWHIICAIISNR